MKLNRPKPIICIKLDKKIKSLKNVKSGLLKIFRFKKPKNLRFSKPFSSPACSCSLHCTALSLQPRAGKT